MSEPTNIQGERSQAVRGDSPALLRTMGLFSLVVYGVGDMVGAGIYGTIGKAAGAMGNAVWLAFAISMVAALLTGLSYASLASRYPRAAGAAYVTHRAFHWPFLSYLIGLSVAASGLTSMGAQANVFADNLLVLIGGPRLVLMLLFILVMTGINLWGIRQSIWTNLVCTTVEVGGLLFIIAVGARFWGSVNYLEAAEIVTNQGQRLQQGLSASLLLSGAVLTFYAFIGFEDMLNVAEEVKEPRRTMPWGIVLAQAIATVLYMGIAVTAVSVVDYRELAVAGSPMNAIASRAAPWLPGQTYVYVTLFAVANTMLINYIMGSRLLYGMARQGLLPAMLGRVHRSRHTPHVAILALLAIVIVLALTNDSIRYLQGFTAGAVREFLVDLEKTGPIASLASATSLLLLFSFLIVNGSLIALKLRPSEPPGAFEVPIAIPALGMLVNGTLIFTRFKEAREAGWLAPIIAGVIVAGISALYFCIRPTNVTEETLAAVEEA
ncbi:MAG TPA: APC family permease [Lacipirellulaceae bacterium]